jgi:hypothetical protein
MTIQPRAKKEDKEKKNPALKADPETLHTTDPQEDMKGPVSSAVQNVKDKINKDDKESKKEADRKKDKNM